MSTVFTPSDLYQALKNTHTEMGNFLVVDVSSDKSVLVEMTYNDLGLFSLVRMVPINLPITVDTVETDLLPEIDMYCSGSYPYIYLIGEYATDKTVQALMSQKATHADATPLGAGRMPRSVPLTDYLKRQEGKMPYDLVLVMLQMPSLDARQARNDEMRIVYEVIIPQGKTLRNNSILVSMELNTTLIGKEMNLYLTKDKDGEYEDYGVCYTVIPQKSIFKLIITFNDGNLRYQWVDATPTDDNPFQDLLIPRLDDICPVFIDFIPPKVLFIVEGALGLKRLIPNIDPAELEKVTDFAVVRQFIGNMTEKLMTSLKGDTLYNVWFYHDYHPNLNIPYEFHKANLKHPPLIIEKLSPSFVKQADLNKMLKDEDDGVNKPSVAIDWQKPLEVVAHELNQMDWGNAGMLLVWIGQSAPHHYHNPDAPNLHQGGIWSEYDFDSEIIDLHRKEITQLSLFVSNDLPIPRSIQRASKRIWQQIASQPTESYFHEIRLTSPEDASFDNNALRNLYDVLDDLFLQHINVLTFLTQGNSSMNMWRLPIKDFIPYTQIHHED